MRQLVGQNLSYEMDTAQRYRHSAALLRSIASGDEDPKTRDMLLRVVAEYERTAADFEALHQANLKHDQRRDTPSPQS